MLIEVTEKEAIEIYSQRYIEQRSKLGLPLFLISIVATLGVFFLISTYINDWLAVSAILLMMPFFYVNIRLVRASSKYAHSQIEEIR